MLHNFRKLRGLEFKNAGELEDLIFELKVMVYQGARSLEYYEEDSFSHHPQMMC